VAYPSITIILTLECVTATATIIRPRGVVCPYLTGVLRLEGGDNVVAVASISFNTTYDVDGEPIRVDFDLVNMGVRVWYAIWINDVKADRFRTDNQGNVTGFQDPVPIEYINPLLAIGSFSTSWSDESRIPATGVVAGVAAVVEDTFGDGAIEFPNVGTWTIELRYD